MVHFTLALFETDTLDITVFNDNNDNDKEFI